MMRRWPSSVIGIISKFARKMKISARLFAMRLTRIPGIHHILEVEDVPFTSLHDIFEQTLPLWARGAGRQNLLRASEASRQT
ncbi:tRNA sulfurtransferase [Serratia liquefaciens]|nr:tRNA sulfurtransferase [Serratia liquefaciens]